MYSIRYLYFNNLLFYINSSAKSNQMLEIKRFITLLLFIIICILKFTKNTIIIGIFSIIC